MAKEIYIDGNGNENLVSGTINNAEMLPIESGSATDTKSYIDNINTTLTTALSDKLDKSAIKSLTGTGTTDASGIITSTALGIAQLDYGHHMILGVQSSTNGCVVNVGQYNTNFYYVCSNASSISVPMANATVTITIFYMDRYI